MSTILTHLSCARNSLASIQALRTLRHSADRKLDTSFFISACRNSSRRTLDLLDKQITSSSFAIQPGAFARQQLVEIRQSQLSDRVRWYRSKPASRPRANAVPFRRDSYPGPEGLNQSSSFRRKFDQIPREFIVWGIIGLNGAVYLAWVYAQDQYRSGNPSPIITMCNNVLLSWRNIREGRIWTIITSTFSHSNPSHILLNCLSFYFLAPPIVQLLGNTSFMALYLFGGVSCSTLSLLLNKSLAKREGASNGASGAIFAVMSFFACVSPKTPFVLFFVIPLPAWALVTGLFVWDGLSALTDRATRIDGAGHVGGILAGVAYYLMRRRMFPRIVL